MKILVMEQERGLLFQKGRFIKMLNPGVYYFFGDSKVEKINASGAFSPASGELAVFLRDQSLAAQLAVAEVADQTLALHYIDGRYSECLGAGRYAFWAIHNTHTFEMVDFSAPDVPADFPRHLFEVLPRRLYTKVEVALYQKARLYFDKKLVRLLDEGTYYFWNCGVRVEYALVDTRLLQMEISGQEMLTLDKVTLRINFVCHYKINDYIKIHTEIDDFEEQMHVTLQLALRDFVGRCRLDEILENKEEISRFAYERLKEREGDFFVTIRDAGVKDIILPGEIRDIMNTVLVAEKRAQANVITRREEVASTRSLLNTARLMEENQTLYKLKELEYLERICDNVGSITVGGGADLLSQLGKIVKGA